MRRQIKRQVGHFESALRKSWIQEISHDFFFLRKVIDHRESCFESCVIRDTGLQLIGISSTIIVCQRRKRIRETILVRSLIFGVVMSVGQWMNLRTRESSSVMHVASILPRFTFLMRTPWLELATHNFMRACLTRQRTPGQFMGLVPTGNEVGALWRWLLRIFARRKL